jgi:hypothetical protein
LEFEVHLEEKEKEDWRSLVIEITLMSSDPSEKTNFAVACGGENFLSFFYLLLSLFLFYFPIPHS